MFICVCYCCYVASTKCTSNHVVLFYFLISFLSLTRLYWADGAVFLSVTRVFHSYRSSCAILCLSPPFLYGMALLSGYEKKREKNAIHWHWHYCVLRASFLKSFFVWANTPEHCVRSLLTKHIKHILFRMCAIQFPCEHNDEKNESENRIMLTFIYMDIK